MQGTFYVVGVGPGDPQLMTLKAAKILERCDVWFVPSAFDNGGSMALKIASGVINPEDKRILSHRFPMKQIHRGKAPDPEVKEAWQDATDQVAGKPGHREQRKIDGKDVIALDRRGGIHEKWVDVDDIEGAA